MILSKIMSWNKEEIDSDITRQIANAERCLSEIEDKGKNFYHAIDEYIGKRELFTIIKKLSITNSKENYIDGLKSISMEGLSLPEGIKDENRYKTLFKGCLDGLLIETEK